MRRVLVPLDGSRHSERILPEACDLAGSGGEIILIREATPPLFQRDFLVNSTVLMAEETQRYLQEVAARLRGHGFSVRTRPFFTGDAAGAIDRAVEVFQADIVAISTHGRGPLGRLTHGSVAWRALAHSPVPVFMHHVDDLPATADSGRGTRRIMVPLDGSAHAEKAIPIAEEFALEWNAPLWLVRVAPVELVPDLPPSEEFPLPQKNVFGVDTGAVQKAEEHLREVAGRLHGEVHTRAAATGSVVDTLTGWADELNISHVVIASHGLTGVSRMIVGSVTDSLIHQLHIPVVVVPAMASGRLNKRPVPLEMSADRELTHVPVTSR